MQPTIQAAQYSFLKKQIFQLIKAYQSVNDHKTVATFEALTREKINQNLGNSYPEVEELLKKIMQVTMTIHKAECLLEDFKEFVIPFKAPSAKQIEKVFRKVKKLKQPDFSQLDLREHSFIGWNDPGSQKKFILLYQEQRLIGLSGSISPNIQKGICSLCHEESNVAMFLATTKTASDGTYTKKGNYICHDSENCNRQLTDLTYLNHFAENILA